MTEIKPRDIRAAALALLALAGLFGTQAARALDAAEPQGQPKLPTVQLTAGMHLITAEVAQTETQRATGLMFRKTMAPNDGMVFIFERAGQQCFWMQNTLLPLSIAFVADDGRIVNLDDMKPLTQNGHCSAEPVRFVLEMNQGWFAKRGIKAGARLSGDIFKPEPQKKAGQ